MPAVRNEQARELGRKLGAELRRRQIQKALRKSQSDAKATIAASVRGNPVRMDQSDLKRTRDDVIAQINEAARQRTGMTIDDIELPPKRRTLRA